MKLNFFFVQGAYVTMATIIHCVCTSLLHGKEETYGIYTTWGLIPERKGKERRNEMEGKDRKERERK